ncbi:unnamed protein product [Microthlaspi erraticum]|uniref:Uncharacterized protein n=1 Tax=Microthlaspi erraticum TaxID=1685480 RepID=A0A6D2IGL7_9BRAS|nr:unnamed protein product [Microthlaspi erraticum]
MFRARPNLVRPSEVSAKVQTIGRSRKSRPGKLLPAVGHATPRPRTTKAREPGVTPRGRATPRVPRPMHPSDRETTSRVRPRFHRPNFTVRPQPADHASVRPRPFRLGHTRLSGRSSRTTVPTPRSTRSPF